MRSTERQVVVARRVLAATAPEVGGGGIPWHGIRLIPPVSERVHSRALNVRHGRPPPAAVVHDRVGKASHVGTEAGWLWLSYGCVAVVSAPMEIF